MDRRLLHACAVVLLAHAAGGAWLLGGAQRGDAQGPAPSRMAAMQVVAPRIVEAPARATPPPVRDEAQRLIPAAAPARSTPQAEPRAPAPERALPRAPTRAEYVAPADLDRAALPRSAPDISLLEGLSFSGLPMRLRLFVDRVGRVDDVAVLQTSDDDAVVGRVRQMFLRTAFVAGRRRGEDVASYKDVELTLGPAP